MKLNIEGMSVKTAFLYSVGKNKSFLATVGRICNIRETGDYLIIGLNNCYAFQVPWFCSVERQDYL
jgi:hypothetical protein